MVEHVPFKLKSEFEPQGDQPQAIQKIVDGVNEGKRHQTLLGATGTGKTFTMSNVIKEVGKPTLIIAHNKTLAGQLYSEFKEFFPENRVEYFVSYYDYYQPEAYVPSTDTFIEKDASINDEIDQLRHSATSSLFNSSESSLAFDIVSLVISESEPSEASFTTQIFPFLAYHTLRNPKRTPMISSTTKCVSTPLYCAKKSVIRSYFLPLT